MKYLVMECHEGYAVLMDEDARFVNAANMHYEVGQTVTDPILLSAETKQKPGRGHIIMRAARVGAVAACLVLAGFTGYQFFRPDKAAPHSVVFVSDAAEIEMQLDKDGSVVKLTSDSECGNQIIEKYIESHGRTSDRADTAGDLLALQVEGGYISSGDTVDVLIPSDNSNTDTYKAEFEHKIAELDLNVNIKEVPKPHLKHEPPKAPDVAPVQPEMPEGSKPAAPHETKPGEAETTAAVQQPSEPETPAGQANEPVPAVTPPGHQHQDPLVPPAEHERPTGADGIKGHGSVAPAPAPVLPEPIAPEGAEAPEPPVPGEEPEHGRVERSDDELLPPAPTSEMFNSQ